MQSHLQSQQDLIKNPAEHHVLARRLSKTVLSVWNFMWAKHQKCRQIKATKQQIADWCMISRSSVTRALRILEAEGVIYTQHFIKAPLYNEPNRYFLEDAFTTPDVMEWCEELFKNMCKFSLIPFMFISSMSAVGGDYTPLVLRRIYGIDIDLIRRIKEPETFKSFFYNRHHHPEIEVPFASHQARQAYIVGSETTPRGTPSSLETKTHKRERRSIVNNQLPFTQEQLAQLADFSKEAIDHANKALTRELMAGKAIANQFGYFLSCCKNFKPYQSSKSTPSQSKPRPSTFSPYVEGGKWVPGARIINNDHNYQTSITHVETDREFALNYEKEIHRLTQMTQEELDLAQPNFKGISMQQRAKFDRCPIWSKFSPEEQRLIWNLAHGSACKCRKNENAGLIMPSIAQKLIDNIPAKPDLDSEIAYNPDLYEEVF